MSGHFEVLSDTSNVIFGRYTEEPFGSYYVVTDHQRFRLTIGADTENETFHIGVDAEWADDRPGEMASFTSGKEVYFAPDDAVSIDDNGILTAMARNRGMWKRESFIQFGFVAELPREFVAPVREALSRVRADMQLGEQARGRGAA